MKYLSARFSKMLQNREELNDPQTVTINEARFSVPIGEVVTRQDQLLYCMYCTVLCCMYCTVLYCTGHQAGRAQSQPLRRAPVLCLRPGEERDDVRGVSGHDVCAQ